MSQFGSGIKVEREPGRKFSTFNLLTVLVLIVTALTIAGCVAIFLMPGLMPPAFQPQTPQLLSTAAPLATFTSTPVVAAMGTVPPTWTPPPTLKPSRTPTPLGTPTSTPTPSLTPTFSPSNTPTRTPTPTSTQTDTPTPGPSPTTTMTRSAYPFTLDRSSPMYTSNFANPAGCNWLGVAGQVFDLLGQPVPRGAYVIRVTNGLHVDTFTGEGPAYGPSGWEVMLDNHPRIETHRVQLFTPSGTPVSQVYEFATRASCNMNLTLMTFVQNH